MEHGFHIRFDGRRGQAVSTDGNMRSALANPMPVDSYLREELTANRIAEIADPAGRGISISRFGVIPKKGQHNQRRLILDLSSPRDKSVNNHISRDLASLHYVSVDRAVEKISTVWAWNSPGKSRY